MAITKPAVLPPWAESGDAVQPTNAEIQSGWQAGSVPPSRQRFNWILNYCMNGVRYLVRRGLADWDAAETYAVGDRVIGPTGSTYQALTANTNKTPAANPSDWAPWAFGPSDVASVSSDNSGKLATTSWIRSAMSNIASAAGFSALLSSTGYIVFPSWLGGLIVQWGKVGDGTSAAADVVISGTFPFAFPNACFVVVASIESDATAVSSNWGCYAKAASLSAFSVVMDMDSSSALTKRVNWIAIGN